MAEQRFIVSCEGDHVRVVVPMPPLSERRWQSRETAFWMQSLMLFQSDPRPRALFEIDADRFRMTLTAADLAERIEADWPRKDIVALRKNGYGPGLWIRVQGTIMETYLEDLDDELTEALSAELWKMIRKFDEPSTGVNSAGIEDTNKPPIEQL
ncbi:hypothetical protein Enr10x_35620 [Gimesia panareensis]|uniref:Uncharacterized protein n=1 Tax=Gimesia panareensis TaxID=2527978 RepID=A0A517Q9C2_9PLAN|nr:hypothetical protein [Gimesia panareensis]QDT28222.1 hypothetical protein Enr10x_35620 [Gimesia panareensis]